MALRERTAWLLLLFIVCIVVLVGSIGFLVSRAKMEVQNAKVFCESLTPLLEMEKAVTGRYPDRLNPDWWKGEEVPKFLKGRKFYWTVTEGQCFVFGFKYPSFSWRDYLEYNSQQGRWVAYD